jgi:frataxin-like iron-binding protein CyaY
MLNEPKLIDIHWREAIYIVVYILNRAQLIFNHDKTPYELWFGIPTSIKHFIVLGRKFYIKRDDDTLGKLIPDQMKAYFLVTHPIESPIDATI